MHDRSIGPMLLAGVLALACEKSPAEKQREVMMKTEENKAAAEADIRQQIEGLVTAVRSKDIDRVMSFYSPEIVSFDVEPPLQYVNTKRWKQTFAAFEGPIAYEVRDLSVTSGDDVAFAHSLNHSSGTMKNGAKTDLWVRWTACFRKVMGRWLIVHDHVSVPVDPASGKASLELKP
jgi:ketosteroid isomerase-like protein